MRKLLPAAMAAIALVCPRVASGQNLQEPNHSEGPFTISAQCSTPTSGCAAGQFASIKVNGRNTVLAQIITANFTGTLAAYASMDGGANWFSTVLRNTPGTGNSATSTSTAFAASTATSNTAIIVPFGGVTDVMLASTAAVTNTATVQLVATNSVTNLAYLGTLKGQQPQGTVGLSTQDLKDASRTFVVLGADGITPAIAETVITFSQNKAGTVTGSATTYAITAAKTLRLQSLACSFTAGATANRVRVAVRLNTGGACVAGSGLLMPAMELAPPYGTATAAEGGAYGEIPFPDGLELTGASWNICLTENATAAAGTLTCTLTGYEY